MNSSCFHDHPASTADEQQKIARELEKYRGAKAQLDELAFYG